MTDTIDNRADKWEWRERKMDYTNLLRRERYHRKKQHSYKVDVVKKSYINKLISVLNVPKCKDCNKPISYKGCIRCASCSKKGVLNYSYKGGISKEDNKFRNSLEYRRWRDSVYARDDYTCQKYKIKNGKLVAHHIESFHAKPELRLDINNGITLSKIAHKEFHTKYGLRNNTREQLVEFLGQKCYN